MCRCEINAINQYLSRNIFIFMMGIYIAFLLISYIVESKYYLYSLIAFFFSCFCIWRKTNRIREKRMFLKLARSAG